MRALFLILSLFFGLNVQAVKVGEIVGAPTKQLPTDVPPFVVALGLSAKAGAKDDDIIRSYCTASVIHKRAILTARHCLRLIDFRSSGNNVELAKIPGISLHAIFSNTLPPEGIKISDPGYKHIKIAKVELFPVRGTRHEADDIAIGILSEDIPSEYSPISVGTEKQPVPGFSKVRIYGYSWAIGSKVLRVQATRSVTLQTKDFPNDIAKDDQGLQELIQNQEETFLAFGAAGRIPCEGSSGGPFLVQENGSWRQISVLTDVSADCKSKKDLGAEEFKSEWSNSEGSNLNKKKEWIKSILKENGLK